MTLVVSLPGFLSFLPVNGLPLGGEDDLRVIDRACVVHAPAPAVTALVRRDQASNDEDSGPWPLSLAIVDPDPTKRELEHARAPNGAAMVVSGPATKERIRLAMASVFEPRSVLHIAGHYASPDPEVPASGGLSVDGDVLSLRDLIDRGTDGLPRFRLPRRVLLSLCESLGAGASDSAAVGHLDVTTVGRDWLGLAAGTLLAGATDVVATTWPLIDDESTARLDGALALALTGPRPQFAVRDVLLDELHAARERSRPVMPAVWLAYCYLGAGRVTAEPESTGLLVG